MARRTAVDELERWVDGVDFPARRTDLLAAALRRTPPDWVVEHLGRLPDREFDDVDDVCHRNERRGRDLNPR